MPQANQLEARRREASSSLRELLHEIRAEGGHLVRKEIQLVRAELREDLRDEAMAVGGLGVAGAGAIVGVILLLVTAILALARVMPAWGAGLIVSGAVLLVSAAFAVFGWGQRVRKPLEQTREVLKGDLQLAKQFTKERLA